MNSLEKRRDVRSEEVFEENIKDFTEREFYWGITLRYDFTERGFPCSVVEHGVDNEGKLIKGRLPNHNVDKIYHFDDGRTIKIEIKTIEERYTEFFTFKVYSLQCCCNQDAYIVVPRLGMYYMIPKETCKFFLDKYDHKIYHGFSKTDRAVRIFMKEIDKMIETGHIIKKLWTPKAKNYIEENTHILFREKAR